MLKSQEPLNLWLGDKVTILTTTVHVYFLFLLLKNKFRKYRNVFVFPSKRMEAKLAGLGHDFFQLVLIFLIVLIDSFLKWKMFQYIFKKTEN